jgi:hypothetical protein
MKRIATSSNIDEILDEIIGDNDLVTNSGGNTRDIQETSDTSNQILFINNGWNDNNEKILKNLLITSTDYKWAHTLAMNLNILLYNIFSITLIILSTGLSIEISTKNTEQYVMYKNVSIYIMTVLTVVQKFLKLEETSTIHKNALAKHSKLYHEIQQKLSMYRRERGDADSYITRVIRDMDEILNDINVNSFVSWRFRVKFGRSLSISGTDNTTNNVTSPSNLESNCLDINNAVQNDISDKTIQDMSQTTINKLNVYHLQNKQLEYEYSRMLK